VLPTLNVEPGAMDVVSVAHDVEVVGGVQVTILLDSVSLRSTSILAGQPIISGSVLSVIVTLNVHVDVLPVASVAVYVTGVVPRLNVDPDAISGAIVAQFIVVGDVHVTIFEHSFAPRPTVIFVGQPVITGAVLSVTITLKVQVDWFPAASMAVYVTAVTPRLNVVPGMMFDVIEAQLVVVGGVQVTTFEHSFVARLTVMFDGQPVMTGAVLSVTVTLKVHVDLFPAASVAV
jgi:hypothetical protein